jgi:hypothetical protein
MGMHLELGPLTLSPVTCDFYHRDVFVSGDIFVLDQFK